MNSLRTRTASIGLALTLTGCGAIDQIRYTTAEIAGRAIVIECALSADFRKQNLNAINGWLTTNVYTPRAMALDCDGDGSSDF